MSDDVDQKIALMPELFQLRMHKAVFKARIEPWTGGPRLVVNMKLEFAQEFADLIDTHLGELDIGVTNYRRPEAVYYVPPAAAASFIETLDAAVVATRSSSSAEVTHLSDGSMVLHLSRGAPIRKLR